jgi:carbon starvation protein
MLLEGLLAVIVLIACGAGIGAGIEKNGTLFTGAAAYMQQYGEWASASGLGAKIEAFVTGSANMVGKLGIPHEIIITLMGVFVASFAATTLDTATRIQRYITAELAEGCGLRPLTRKHPATLFAVLTALALAFSRNGGTGALALWPLFGTLNQLLATLALLVITIWLARNRRPFLLTALPMVFMVAITLWSMKINLTHFYHAKQWMLLGIGSIIALLQVWMLAEGTRILLQLRKHTAATTP